MASLEMRIWGLIGAGFAGAFAIWLLFFPDKASDFAWVIEPRLAQVFIGGGYIFRTAFFLNVAIWPRWERFRWIFWGNLAFTGTLLLATFWRAERIRWGTVIGHAWLILYVAEPAVLIYFAIGRSLRSAPAPDAVPIRRGFVRFLILEAALLAMFGALLILNPEFATTRWPWALNPMDSIIVAAWFVGWAVWCGTMAFANDWREVRTAAYLNMIAGAGILAASLASLSLFDSPRPATSSRSPRLRSSWASSPGARSGRPRRGSATAQVARSGCHAARCPATVSIYTPGGGPEASLRRSPGCLGRGR